MSANHTTLSNPTLDVRPDQVHDLANGQTPAETPLRPVLRLRLSTVVATVVFSAVEIWAMIIVLVAFHPGGPAKVALACVVAGTAMAIVLAWQDMHATSAAEGRRPSRRSHPRT